MGAFLAGARGGGCLAGTGGLISLVSALAGVTVASIGALAREVGGPTTGAPFRCRMQESREPDERHANGATIREFDGKRVVVKGDVKCRKCHRSIPDKSGLSATTFSN